MNTVDIESIAHAGRLPGEEKWECERCGRTVDPLSRFYEHEAPPYCHYCREEIDRENHEQDDKLDEQEKKENDEHWAKVDEILRKLWDEEEI